MEIEQVAELARAVAGLPQAERDYFEGIVADERAKAAEAERIAKFQGMSDVEAVQAAIKCIADVREFQRSMPEKLLQFLREAGFVRADVALLREALEQVVRIIVDAAPQMPSGSYGELDRLIKQAATALGSVEAGRS